MTALRSAAAVVALALCGCAGLHQARQSPPPQPSTRVETGSPTVAPESTPSAPTPSAAEIAVPPCIAPETKIEIKTKPKPKPAPKQNAKDTPPPAAPPPPLSPVAIVDAQVKPTPVSVISILGKRVQGPKGEDLGRVVDVLADAGGRVRVAIIDFGGFLGVGDRRIAVDWPLLRFNPDGGDSSLSLAVSRDQLKGAPEYKDIAHPLAITELPAPDNKK